MSVFNSNEMIPVPASVAVCPHCGGPMLVCLHEWISLVEEANLWAPGEEFCLECPTRHCDEDWEEVCNEDWGQVYDMVEEWLSQTPFLVERVSG